MIGRRGGGDSDVTTSMVQGKKSSTREWQPHLTGRSGCRVWVNYQCHLSLKSFKAVRTHLTYIYIWVYTLYMGLATPTNLSTTGIDTLV